MTETTGETSCSSCEALRKKNDILLQNIKYAQTQFEKVKEILEELMAHHREGNDAGKILQQNYDELQKRYKRLEIEHKLTKKLLAIAEQENKILRDTNDIKDEWVNKTQENISQIIGSFQF